jgi:hypothetical protein
VSPEDPKPRARRRRRAPAAEVKRPASKPRSRRERAIRPRLRAGEAIYLLAAILLFVLMFFDWYGTKAASGGEQLNGVVTGAGGGSAWQTMELIPLLLMLAIVVAVGAAILRLSGTTWKPAVPPAAAVAVLGGVAAILILIRIVSPPGPEGAFSELAFEATLKPAVFLALAAAIGIAYGGWRAMAAEGTSFGDIAKRLESPERPPQRPQPSPAKKLAARPKS